ncbi:arsenate reductase/protein-tyrosine-phosphatase family protein [Curtobacterium sp. Leaf261]|uniref:arsenate reductase/protein-tyrosine-phosphatase family protein n=1 Tax=Curtobacterium sp. Leaf261 TaxID=1736311 RepID=UPI0006F24DAD|nr:hypothetical protein [Curtobacterium sp. Leaf261]KQO62329.1 hypothetical protein ASF23_11070 [Curtobacterium sp. Leaf261]
MTTTGPGVPPASTILFVCTGNICRSPLAEQLLRARLTDAATAADAGRDSDAATALRSITIRSAGTQAEHGAPMDHDAATQSTRLGADPSAHGSTPLTEALVASADLVLTAERSHRAAVVRMLPRASRTTFTVRQAARLIIGLEERDRVRVTDLPTLVGAMAIARSYVPPVANEDADDVQDPYRRSAETHQRVADEIAQAVDVIADAVRSAVARQGDRS